MMENEHPSTVECSDLCRDGASSFGTGRRYLLVVGTEPLVVAAPGYDDEQAAILVFDQRPKSLRLVHKERSRDRAPSCMW